MWTPAAPQSNACFTRTMSFQATRTIGIQGVPFNDCIIPIKRGVVVGACSASIINASNPASAKISELTLLPSCAQAAHTFPFSRKRFAMLLSIMEYIGKDSSFPLKYYRASIFKGSARHHISGIWRGQFRFNPCKNTYQLAPNLHQSRVQVYPLDESAYRSPKSEVLLKALYGGDFH